MRVYRVEVLSKPDTLGILETTKGIVLAESKRQVVELLNTYTDIVHITKVEEQETGMIKLKEENFIGANDQTFRHDQKQLNILKFENSYKRNWLKVLIVFCIMTFIGLIGTGSYYENQLDKANKQIEQEKTAKVMHNDMATKYEQFIKEHDDKAFKEQFGNYLYTGGENN